MHLASSNLYINEAHACRYMAQLLKSHPQRVERAEDAEVIIVYDYCFILRAVAESHAEHHWCGKIQLKSANLEILIFQIIDSGGQLAARVLREQHCLHLVLPEHSKLYCSCGCSVGGLECRATTRVATMAQTYSSNLGRVWPCLVSTTTRG